MRAGKRAVFAFLSIGSVTACAAVTGLSDYDIVEEAADASSADRSVVDVLPAPVEGGADEGSVDAGPPPCLSDAAICDALPGGWSPVAVANANASCPPGFASADVYKSAPVAGAGTCGCEATATVPAKCQDGTLAFKIGVGCQATGAVVNVAGAACSKLAAVTAVADHSTYPKLAPTGGSCVGQPVVDATKIATTPVTLCAPVACRGAVCEKAAPSGFNACVVANGDVACPSGFADKRLVGAGATATCAACTCMATATCSQGTATLYQDPSCGGAVVTLLSDVCNDTVAQQGMAVRSAKYVATATPSYVADGPKTATGVALTDAKTVCCAP